MDPVNSLTQLMQALRQQMAAQTRKSDRATGQSAKRSKEAAKQQVAGKTSIEQIRSRVRERIGQLEPDQRDSEQAAKIFVESILVWEFGEDLLHDPRFQNMSREVRMAMLGDPDTRERFRELLRTL